MMADTRKVEFPEETIPNITDQPQNEPGNNVTPIVELDNSLGSFPPLLISTDRPSVLTPLSRSKIPRLKPRQIFPSNPDPLASYADQVKLYHEGRTSRPKWGSFPSVLSKSEDRDQKVFVSTPAKRKLYSASQTPKTHDGSLKTKLGRSTSVESKPERTSRSISVTKPSPRDIALSMTLRKSMSYASPLQTKPGATECNSPREATPVSYADRLKLSHDVQTSKPKWGSFPSVLSKSQDGDKKMFASTPAKPKIDSSVESQKTPDQSHKNKFGRSTSSLSKSELATPSVAVTKPNPRDMTLSLTLRKSLSHTDPLQNENAATECKSTREASYPKSHEVEKGSEKKTNADKLAMNSACNADTPTSYADVLRVSNDCMDMEVHPECENIPDVSDASKQGHQKCKTHIAKSKKMDSLCDFDIPLQYVNRLRQKTSELQHECENIRRKNRDLDLKYPIQKEDASDMDSECSLSEPKSNADLLTLSTTSPELQPGCKRISPGSDGSHVLDQKCENHNAVTRVVDLKPSPDKPVSCADPLKLNSDGRKCKPKWGHFSSVLSKSEKSSQKIFMATPSQRKIDTPCETPKSNVDSQKRNPRTRQFNTKLGQYTSVVSRNERSKMIIAEPKSNQIKPLMGVLVKPVSHAGTVKLNPEAKEFKPTRGTRLPLPRKAENVNNKHKANADTLAMDPTCNPEKLANDVDVLKLIDSKEMLPECANNPADSGESKNRDQNCEAHNSESDDVWCSGCNLDKSLSCTGELDKSSSCTGELDFSINFRESQPEYEQILLRCSSGVNGICHTYAHADKCSMDATDNPDIPTRYADVVQLNNDFRDMESEFDSLPACFWESEYWNQNWEIHSAESEEMDSGCETAKRMSYARLLTLNTRMRESQSELERIPLGSCEVNGTDHLYTDSDVHGYKMNATASIPAKSTSSYNILQNNPTVEEYVATCTSTYQNSPLDTAKYMEHLPLKLWSSQLNVDIPHDNTDISNRYIQDVGRSLPMPVNACRSRGLDHLAYSKDDGPKTPELWRSSAPWSWSNLPPIHKPQQGVPNVLDCLRQDEGVSSPAVEAQQDYSEKGAVGLLAISDLLLEAPKLEMSVDEFTKMVGDTFSETWMTKMRIIVYQPPSGTRR
ncbi:hypothetical protein BsWGS_16764 [Bradybaena similaris]